jgi:hypothetical protein
MGLDQEVEGHREQAPAPRNSVPGYASRRPGYPGLQPLPLEGDLTQLEACASLPVLNNLAQPLCHQDLTVVLSRPDTCLAAANNGSDISRVVFLWLDVS